MNEGDVIEVLRGGFYAVLIVTAPALLAALASGLFVSILQALTQVQEMTLSNIPKIFITLLATMFSLPFGFAAMRAFMDQIIQMVVGI